MLCLSVLMALLWVLVVVVLSVGMSLALNDVVDMSEPVPVARGLWESLNDGDGSLDLLITVPNFGNHLSNVLDDLDGLLDVDLSHDGGGDVDDLLDFLINFLLDGNVVEFPVGVLLRHGLIVNARNASCPGDLLNVGLFDHDLLLDNDRLPDGLLNCHDLGLLGHSCYFVRLLDVLDGRYLNGLQAISGSASTGREAASASHLADAIAITLVATACGRGGNGP